MSIGSGIFLAGLCLALVALYAVTRDRWAWKRIVVRTLLALVGLIVVVGSGLFFYKQWADRPKVVESFGGVSLTDRRPDVVFKLGAGRLSHRYDLAQIDAYLASDQAKLNPSYAADAQAARVEVVALAKLGEETFAKNAQYVFGEVDVEFKDDVVHTIARACKTDGLDFTEINGVSCGTSGEKIQEKFGDAVRILCSSQKAPEAGEQRVFDVVSLGTRFYLTKNQVSGHMVVRPETLRGFTTKGWIACE